MYFLEYFYTKTLKHDLINKFYYKNTQKLPKVTKIILNFGCKTIEIKKLAASLLALELITNKKGIFTVTKKSNIFLKIRKGNPAGCKVVLKKRYMLNFFSKTMVNIFPKMDNVNYFYINKKLKKNAFSYEINDTFIFSELENSYYLFNNNLPKLNITVVTNSNIKEELVFITKSFQIPLKYSL